MKKIIYKSFDFLLFGNVFVAVCAVVQALVTYSFFGLKPDSKVCGFLFFSTFAYYNFCLLINKTKASLYPQHDRNNWFFAHRNLNLALTIVAGFATVPFFLALNYWPKVLVLFLGFLSATYNFPQHRINSSFINLRNIKGLKLFLIAFVWALSVVLLPVLQASIFIPQREITFLIIKQFLLFLAVTIPFDVRDFMEDKASNLKTVPIIWGIKNAYRFSITLLLINLLLVFCFKNLTLNSNFFASVFTPIFAVFVILSSGLRKSKYYYFLYLDGILVLQYLLLLVFNILK